MEKLNYANYIITDPPLQIQRKENGPALSHILGVNGQLLKGAFHVNCAWIMPGPNPGVLEAHSHPHDEIIGFISTDLTNPGDLGAEAELWIENEKYLIRKNFLAFFPKGMVHCPLTVTNVRQPILHFDIQITQERPQFLWVNGSKNGEGFPE